jgi:hypothetical protein
MRGISSPGLSLSESLELACFSGGGGGIDEKEDLVGETDDRFCDPCVLLLNLDGSTWLCDIVLSLLEEAVLGRNITLCRAVRSKIFFSIEGKNSVRWFEMSSLGGRCPKKLRSLDGLFALCAAVFEAPEVGDGGSRAFSGSVTPSPLSMLMELARLVLLFAGPASRNLLCASEGLPFRSSYRLDMILRTVRPCSREG